MTRRFGIIIAICSSIGLVAFDWTLGMSPDPFQAPDPLALGSREGASGAICSFMPSSP